MFDPQCRVLGAFLVDGFLKKTCMVFMNVYIFA
jgi:hypothetical protein